ncbi:hypothetical protein [uncultured Litoreibacter sp.]|uniref:hypothetical protein n=1 Tax=uncultured Litoreibacter sp. TaxID=1392394 RepID=UPI002610E3D9|nr:hypothetical protein [uncultured Litoreibacter sp.]
MVAKVTNSVYLFGETYPELHWLFETYLDGDSDRDEFLEAEVKDNNGPSKPRLKQDFELFLEYRPLRHEDYERKFKTDFASETALYNYVLGLYQWIYKDSPEPDLIDFLAD